ncbi:DUF2480 family protein [Sphingobacterium sp. N143]|uniref:DUF2480 family protein n=1 Tax=Sphingobacterium sp. N143 TaxID=2746727 RepID=UPI002577926F|nr:DUF2480 family protein [Sphingobacterium sp. N143]MDM1295071.1 DUF2480 family protein [Sphingobacterium sp. N143]
MEIQTNIVNKVAQSGLVTVDLADYHPNTDNVLYDIKDNLFHGLILKEKDFREFIKAHDWSQYSGKHVAITCTADAIIPTWAYMLLANKLEPYATRIIFGDLDELLRIQYAAAIEQIDMLQFQDQRVVVKGCGDILIPESVFVQFTVKLSKVAKSIMYGEPCSTVPVFKRTNKEQKSSDKSI